MDQPYSEHDKHYVAVDVIIFGFDAETLRLLLIERDFEPEKGKWSLIGGFLKKNCETLRYFFNDKSNAKLRYVCAKDR